MVRVMVKAPDENPYTVELDSLDSIRNILEGEFEIIEDDKLSEIVILTNEEARGVRANNFPITSEGFLDWVYGTCIFTKLEENQFESLSEENIRTVNEYLTKRQKGE